MVDVDWLLDPIASVCNHDGQPPLGLSHLQVSLTLMSQKLSLLIRLLEFPYDECTSKR
jgi:hypothetical protein